MNKGKAISTLQIAKPKSELVDLPVGGITNFRSKKPSSQSKRTMEPSQVAKVIAQVKNTVHQFTATVKKKEDSEDTVSRDGIVIYRGMKMTIAQRQEYKEMEEDQIHKFRQNYYPAKFASKKNGVVVTYAANTH